MKKDKVIQFFDMCAESWDNNIIRNEDVIKSILENAHIENNIQVLDVACGTGVLFPDYLSRGACITAIDISSEMVKRAKSKYPGVDVICGDVEEYVFDRKYDVVMVYNSIPHFTDPYRLVACLANILVVGGRISIAHGMSRECILNRHAGSASEVSVPLLEWEELARILDPFFEIETCISNEHMYQVVGVKR
ncbi:MAG: class I SAM-dependent methyltransferase [Erysipelotrichaceae bacterium]|nr:class I SAM-dependent methyltransferase [Erysipelotrichaceae bacterium]